MIEGETDAVAYYEEYDGCGDKVRGKDVWCHNHFSSTEQLISL